DLTEADKKAKTEAVDQAVTDANESIEKSTKDGVETATEAGKSAIDQVVTAAKELDAAKAAAKQAIADKAKAAKTTIAGLKDLTEDDKKAKTAEVDQVVTDANESIDKATKDEVASEQSKGETTIDQIVKAAQDLDSSKAAAKQAIADKAKAAKAIINGLKDLTEADKKAKAAEVDQAVTDANEAIEKSTKDGVETATEAGKSAIDQVVTAAKELDAAKAVAKQAIADKAKEAKTTIAGLKDLTEADKKAKTAEVDQAVTDANAAIEKATKDGVETATEAGK
ncbi:DUF1542 domain-containing protein, partial [Ligilactobacillus ceti]|uniref:DUF1542 domain-containing protein n=1 Tax=Ligilactobacillus ceti TaxID=395085 RepID=UPI00137B4885